MLKQIKIKVTTKKDVKEEQENVRTEFVTHIKNFFLLNENITKKVVLIVVAVAV